MTLMTENAKNKLILLSCAKYDERPDNFEKDFGKTAFFHAVRSMFDSGDWSCLKETFTIKKLDDDDGFSYSESDLEYALDEIDCIEIINAMRDFNIYEIKDFSEETDKTVSNPPNKTIKSSLVFEKTGVFMVITEIDMDASNGDVYDEIENVYRNKEIGKNLGIEKQLDSIFRLAEEYIEKFFKCFDENIKTWFSIYNTHPIFLSTKPGSKRLSNIFSNEEIIDLEKSAISDTEKDRFFHAGWNYSVATRFPGEGFAKIIELTCASQVLYFLLEYYKSHFYDEFYESFSNRETLTEKDLEKSDLMSSAFYDLNSKTFAFRNKLFPKYRSEMNALLERWNCFDDINWIKENIRHSDELKVKLHQRKVEEQNRRQTIALSFIGLFQVLAIFDAVNSMSTIALDSFIYLAASTAIAIVALAVYGTKSREFGFTATFSLILIAIFALISGNLFFQ